MDNICVYLRKSRADLEMEKTIGEMETLTKHRKALLKFAKEKKLNIVDIKEELVSGESLFHRPKMLELLNEVEAGAYKGVLVMDMQRLGRGDMQEQGLILKTFKDSNTVIITPQKTYDLNNDFDEEYSEFEAFMSRKELKMINRRMQGGRIRSVEEGNYIAANPPFGYDITHINKSRTLSINPYEADIVKIIFDMYISGNGSGVIADYLNSLGYKTKNNNPFERSSILTILKNPVYIGKVTWKKKEIKKSKNPNKVKDTRTRDKSEWIISDGKHEAIIDTKTFNAAKEILEGKYHIPYQLVNGPVNPLAGILICEKCSSKMVMRKLRGIERILCTKKCGNISMRFDDLEKEVVSSLSEYLNSYMVNIESDPGVNNISVYETQIAELSKELEVLNGQKLKLYDLLEQGIYTNEVFLERSKNVNERIESITAESKRMTNMLNKEKIAVTKSDVIVLKKLLDGYKRSINIQQKNSIMKALVYKIEYLKESKGTEFRLKLYPKLKR